MVVMTVSILFTLLVLVLSLVTISKGYGFEHKVDPLVEEEDSEKDISDKKEIQ